MLEVGETIEHYRVEALLGVGDPVSSYRVVDLEGGTSCTLELLTGLSPADRDRVLTEGQLRARLVHPNLLGVSDVLLVDDWPAMVTEVVGGSSLEGWLAEGRISVDIALALFRGIVTGVGVAHAVGLVHRCLKPENVLLGRGRSGAMVPKVTGFGLCHGGRVTGLQRYLAPEQLRDPGGADLRADLWALGCLLYELVCGVPAFPATDRAATFEAITHARYEDPRASLAPRTPARVIDTIRELLEPDRELRIASCTALWERLWDVPVPTELRDGVPLKPEVDAEAPTVMARKSPSEPPLPHDAPLALADWSPTPMTAEPRTAPAATVSRSWYLGAILVAAVPAGIFAIAVGAMVLERSRGGAWPELPSMVAGLTATGTVTVEGDAIEVWLEADGARHGVDRPVPVGKYQVRASWDDGVPRNVGQIEVRSGTDTRVRCASAGYACAEVPPE